MLIAHRVELDPIDRQRTAFARATGTARFAYNWALAEWRRRHEAREKDRTLPAPSEMALRRDLNALKRSLYPWMLEVTKCAVQEAVIDLGAAFRSFFDRRGRYPRFKRRGVRDGFCAANEAGNSVCDDRRIKLPRVGSVRMREALRFPGQPRRVTVSREADRWFASVLVEVADPAPLSHPEPCVGVDLGITTLATLSTGEAIPGPRAHKALLGRLRRTSRGLSRKRKGSANRAKAKRRLARLHARIAAIRRDATHKATTALARRFARIGIEELNVRGMARNRSLARSIMDGAFGEFRRQLVYKARMTAALLVVADRWYPSSKTCACCSAVRTELALSQRVFRCDACGHEADRGTSRSIRSNMAFTTSRATRPSGVAMTRSMVPSTRASRVAANRSMATTVTCGPSLRSPNDVGRIGLLQATKPIGRLAA